MILPALAAFSAKRCPQRLTDVKVHGATENPARLRICLLSYRSNPHSGGQGVYLKNLSRALKDLGHHVEVVSGPPDPCLDDDIPLIRIPGLDLYNPDNLFRMPSFRELLDPINLIEWMSVSTMGFPEPFTFGIRAHKFLRCRANRYDIVHDNQSLSYGVRAISRAIPTIATIHHPISIDRDMAVKSAPSLWEKMKQLRWYSFIRMQKRVARTFSHIITVSEHARKDLQKGYHIPFHRFHVIPNGIDTKRFYPMPELMREKNRLIVTNSADTPLKGLKYLLLAIVELSKTRKIRLVVVGRPKKNGSIENLIRRLGISEFVDFTGPIDPHEFVRQYALASVAIVPSLYEGFGLPAGEAMACGVPVVSTTGGALPEVVGNAGILVPPADPMALAKSIGKLLDHPDRAREIGEAGYLRVRKTFTWQTTAEQTVRSYRETIRDYVRL